jgi:hypothetical protein
MRDVLTGYGSSSLNLVNDDDGDDDVVDHNDEENDNPRGQLV